MTRTRYYTATTLDGFIADPDNSLDWLFAVDNDGATDTDFQRFFGTVGALCMGATTYEWVREHQDEANWAEAYGDTPAWVFTHRDLPAIPGANLRFVAGAVEPVHRDMAAAAGAERDIWVVGGGELAGAFADAGLLDELIVSVAPATLGAGAPLLPRRIMPDRLKLTEVERIGQFAQLTYSLTGSASD
ncbi:dihydrofolate reductase family protein [Nocardia takedensis]|uniref:dihydrofolate reductase family protein n=1 Tax=Nocardia takedensis TaxID=259390 RepID=UPI0002DEACEA|nr:dihydrofolate reductase family protein [Nocardia takedensis]